MRPTTEKTRREIQLSKESIATLARRFGVNRKTITKWKNRTTCQDAPMGPNVRRSKVLTSKKSKLLLLLESLQACL